VQKRRLVRSPGHLTDIPVHIKQRVRAEAQSTALPQIVG
jgi:hypothetical protein